MNKNILEIDGRAGGQALRTSIALSAITRKPVIVFNIRANRPNPGLKAQHLTSINALSKICGAKVNGAKKFSKKITFFPRKIFGGIYSINIGTAGSISLLLQSILLPCLLSKSQVKLRIVGGTDVAFAPPVDYLKEVLFPLLSKMNARFELSQNKRGYYPEGNGFVTFNSLSSPLPLKPINLTEQGELEFIKIISHSSGLPKEVSLNQLSAAKKLLQEKLSTDFEEITESNELSKNIGSGISVIGFYSNNAVIAASALGVKGKKSEKVGLEAAEKFLKEIAPKKPVDSHLADQLIPFMAIAQGNSVIECSSLTEHTFTNINVVEKFLKVKFIVDGKINEPGRISVQGIGLQKQ
jgi:RNA 3'-phosphate cyclase